MKIFFTDVLFQSENEIAQNIAEDMKFLKKYVFETSRHQSLEENIKVLDEFYEKLEQKLKGLSFNSEKIAQLSKTHCPPLRKNTDKFFEILALADIPILVFSAGIGNVIEAILRHHNAKTSNVKVAANFFEFDQDTISGFRNPGRPIHSYNKNLRIYENGNEFPSDWQLRSNVILLGDNLGDSEMADGFENAENILKIGFLWANVSLSNLQFSLDLKRTLFQGYAGSRVFRKSRPTCSGN